MDVHKDACLTSLDRERLVKMVLGQTPEAASEVVEVCLRTTLGQDGGGH